MTEAWVLLRAVGLPLVAGLGLVRLAGLPRGEPLLGLGLAWLCGCLATALLTFLWLAAGLPLVAWPLDLALCALAFAGLAGPRPGPVERAAEERPAIAGPERWFGRLCVALALTLVAVRIADGSRLALIVGDGAEHWAGKARHIFGAGGFGAALARATHEPGALTQLDYPLLNPLLQLRVFVHAGGIVHAANKLPIALASLALAAVLAGTLCRLLRPALAGPLLLVAVAPHQAAAWAVDGASDGLVALGFAAALSVWLLRDRLGPTATPRLLAAALAFGLWAKNEGLLFVLAAVVAVPIARLASRRGLAVPRDRRLLWLLLPAAVLLLQVLFNRAHGYASTFAKHEQGDLVSLFLAQAGDRLVPTLRWFVERVLADPRHSLLVFTALLVVALAWPRRNLGDPDLGAPLLAFWLAVAGLLAVFVASPGEFRWQLDTAADRVLFQLQPCAVLLSAALLRARLLPALRSVPRATPAVGPPA